MTCSMTESVKNSNRACVESAVLVTVQLAVDLALAWEPTPASAQ